MEKGRIGNGDVMRGGNPQIAQIAQIAHFPQNAFSEEKGGQVFSFFKRPVRNTLPCRTVSLAAVYKAIKGDRFREVTEQLRAITDEKAARAFKAEHFDYVTFSGVFTKRENSALVRHSGLFAVDFDHVEDVAGLKENLLRDEHFETQLLFVSPSGDGLKWVIPIDLAKWGHLVYALGIGNYVWERYGQRMDRSGKDVARACFLPWDEKVWINPKYV